MIYPLEYVSKKHTALPAEGNEKSPVNVIHKCVDTEKNERSIVNVGQKQEQPPQVLQEQKRCTGVLPL